MEANTTTRGELLRWIDNASYHDLLAKWRSGAAGDPFFQGQVGAHYDKVMKVRKREVGHEAAVATSKSIGW